MRKGGLMIQDIESKIVCGCYRAGEKIPSLRQLMEHFDISLNTARRGIKSLVDKGLLEFRHGSGTYVAEHRVVPVNCRIVVISVAFSPQPLHHLFSGLAMNGVQDAAKSGAFRIEHKTFEANQINDLILERLSEKYDGIIMLGGYDAYLRQPKLHTVAAGLAMHCSFGGMFSLIDLDPFRAAELAVAFFLSHHCCHVVIVTRRRANFQFRGECFKAIFPGKIISTVTEHVEQFDPDAGYLYLSGSDALKDAQEFQRIQGRRLCDTNTILCIDGKPMFSGHTELGIPSIAINWREAGMLVAGECLRRITYPGTAARRIYLSPELY